MDITHIEHIGIAVKNIEEAIINPWAFFPLLIISKRRINIRSTTKETTEVIIENIINS